MNTVEQPIPTGILKQINLREIKRDTVRYRSDFGNMEALVESIKEKGILQPITLTPDLRILAGERRIKAAELAGLEKIPALIRKIDGDVDAREIELIENTFRKDFSWQEEINLIAELDKLYKEKNLDWSGRKTAQIINQSNSHTARQLELAQAMTIIPELAEQPLMADALKMYKKFQEQVIVDELMKRQQASITAAETGEVQHGVVGSMSQDVAARLRIADANYSVADTLLSLAELRTGGAIHLIECDPPYAINLRYVKASKDSVDSNIHDYHEIDSDKYELFLGTLAMELYRVAAPDCWLVFWHGPTWHHEVKMSLQGAGWLVDDIPAIWIKPQGQTLQPQIYLARCYEPFFLCRKGQPYMAKPGRSNVFDFSPVAGARKYHPTERPLPLIEEILSTLGIARQIVLVPFLGSGCTLRACYKLGMLGFGFDISSEYKSNFLLAVEDDIKNIVPTES